MLHKSISRFSIIVSLFDWIQGPYIENTRTHLQKSLGDDNVLVVKFADIPGHMNTADKFGIYCTYYSQVAEDGIILGLRRYRFFSKFFPSNIASLSLLFYSLQSLSSPLSESTTYEFYG